MPDNFGSRLKLLRKNAGLTQEDLADILGIHEATIRRWELGYRQPQLEDIKALAKALGVSEQDLLHDPPAIPNPGEWIINFRTVERFDSEEVIEVKPNSAPVCSINVNPNGCGFVIKATWDVLQTKAGLEKLFKQVVRDFYPPMKAGGIAYGEIPKD